MPDDTLFNIRHFGSTTDQIATYYLESSATTNVDSDDHALDDTAQGILAQTTLCDPAEEISSMARHLRAAEHPELVILVHGYNNPAGQWLNWIQQTHEMVTTDAAIQRRKVIFICYRWPSEGPRFFRGGLRQSSRDMSAAMPGVLWILTAAVLLLGCVGIAGGINLFGWAAPQSIVWQIIQGALLGVFALGVGIGGRTWRVGLGCGGAIAASALGLYLIDRLLVGLRYRADFFALGLGYRHIFAETVSLLWFLVFLGFFSSIAGVFLLRGLVYYRDSYRAVNYGVPDLVEFVRQLNFALGSEPDKPRVRLSFIGHSLGASVVTSLIRILSDVFDVSAFQANPPAGGDQQASRATDIGQAFRLGRLVLVSPDIPGEALMLGRSNFLKSSLRRFEEAYLFSNAGDEALRIISPFANFFTFPASSSHRGQRLGIAELRSPGIRGPRYGILNLADLRQGDSVPDQVAWFYDHIRLGQKTLRQLDRVYPIDGLQWPGSALDGLPFTLHFTYFDCTDYVDTQIAKRGHLKRPAGVISFAKRKDILGWLDHTSLLLQYLMAPHGRRINVHGGYFEGRMGQCLIYRLACLGFEGTLAAVRDDESPAEISPALTDDERQGALDALDKLCKTYQIQVALAPARYVAARKE